MDGKRIELRRCSSRYAPQEVGTNVRNSASSRGSLRESWFSWCGFESCIVQNVWRRRRRRRRKEQVLKKMLKKLQWFLFSYFPQSLHPCCSWDLSHEVYIGSLSTQARPRETREKVEKRRESFARILFPPLPSDAFPELSVMFLPTFFSLSLSLFPLARLSHRGSQKLCYSLESLALLR